MSVNFDQYSPNNFLLSNNITFEKVQKYAPQEQVNLLKTMDVPREKEFISWTPYFLTATGMSILISSLTKLACCINPLKNPNATVIDSFNNSIIGKMTAKIDELALSVSDKISPLLQKLKTGVGKITPKYFKDLFSNINEKFTIGMTPKNTFAVGQSKGYSISTADNIIQSFMNINKKTPDIIQKLGIKNILDDIISKKIDSKAAITAISEHFKKSKITIKEFNKLVGNPKILKQLNIARSFIGNNAKSGFAKIMQKLFMYCAEGASGGIASGIFFGIIMNSIFLAQTIKRTWDAPWGDKFSTFMEGAVCDFCGGMLVNFVIAPRLSYKLLGLKNLDKTATQLKQIKQLEQDILAMKDNHKLLLKIFKSKNIKNIMANKQLLESLFKLNLPENSSLENLQKMLAPVVEKSAIQINNAIDRLSHAKAFKSQGFWKDIIHRPLYIIGSIANVGLETSPSKVKGKMNKNGKLVNVSSFKVFINKTLNTIKALAGFWRFILVMAIVAGPMMSLLTKFSHTVFGKPKKCYHGKDAETETNIPKNPKIETQQYDKMQIFAELTKQKGELSKTTQPINKKENVDNQISPNWVSQIINSQRNKLQTA